MEANHQLYVISALLIFATGLVVSCVPGEQRDLNKIVLGMWLVLRLMFVEAGIFLVIGILLQTYYPEFLRAVLVRILYWKKPQIAKPNKPVEHAGTVSGTRKSVTPKFRKTTRGTTVTSVHARRYTRPAAPSHQSSQQGSLHTQIDSKEQKGPNESVPQIGLMLIYVLVVTTVILMIGKLLQIYKPGLLPEESLLNPCWRKPEPTKKRGFWKIGLTLLVIVGTVTFLVTGKLLQKYKPELLPEVLAWIPCWKKPERKQPQEEQPPEERQPREEHPPEEIRPAEPDPPIERPNPLEEKRDQLRAKIRDYRPGSTGNVENDLAHLKEVNVNLFGLMSAGKSSFINSLFCAFTGTYQHLAAEGTPTSAGSTSKLRAHYKLTNFINLQDNRGMMSFKLEELTRVRSEILAERGVDTLQLIQKDLAKECHCAVFVYHYWPSGFQEAKTFINGFFEEVKPIHASPPMLVITHKNDCPELAASTLEDFTNKDKMLLLENYTLKHHEEDIEKDIELLEFLWMALKSCDINAYNRGIKNDEKPQTGGILGMFYRQ